MHVLPRRRPLLGLAVLALVVLLLMGPAGRAGAGPLPHAAPSVIHDFQVTLNRTGGEIRARFMVSPQLVPQVFRFLDPDGDGAVSAMEQQAWVSAYLAKLRVTVDDQPPVLTVAHISDLSREQFLLSMRQAVSLTLQFPYTLPDAPDHRFTLTDATNYVGYDEYYISYGDGLGAIVTSYESPASNTFIGHFIVSGATTVANPVSGGAAPSGAGGATPGSALFLDQLRDFLHGSRSDPLFGLLIFLLAVGVGGLHALQPGHGKAMVAAYLVGSRGRVGDAVLLGGVVTFTHTSSVVLLGVALLAVNTLALPRAFQPALELLSGALIVGLGGWLLWQRAQALRTARIPLVADHAHPPGDHEHTHGEPGHHHDDQPHAHVPPARASLRDLVGLGVSGGLVPCPEAITILLLAAGVGQVGLGIALVSSFSIGLAFVLIALGVLMVKARGLLERLLPGQAGPAWARWLPVVSAIVVIMLGALVMLGALGQRWS